MMKTYSVSFYHQTRNERGHITKTDYVGSVSVDMKPNDPLTVEAKAFRQASPHQQMATKTRSQLVRVW